MVFSSTYSFKRNNSIPQDFAANIWITSFAKSTYDSILSPFMMFIWIHLLDMILKCTNASGSCVYKDDKKEIDNLEIKNSLS